MTTGNEEKTPDREVVKVTNLTDLAPRPLEIIIRQGDRELVIPVKTLTYQDYQLAGWEVADPVPEIMGAGKDGRPIYNLHSAAYLKEKEMAATERMYRRLIRFLDIPIPGDTVEAQIEALETMLDYNTVVKLAAEMTKSFVEGEARAQVRAKNF